MEPETHNHRCVDETVSNIQFKAQQIFKIWKDRGLRCDDVKGISVKGVNLDGIVDFLDMILDHVKLIQ